MTLAKAILIINSWSKAAQAASIAKRRARQNQSPDLKMARKALSVGDRSKAKQFVRSYLDDEQMYKADVKAKSVKKKRDSRRTSPRGAGSGRG